MFEKSKAGTSTKGSNATEVTDQHKNPIEALEIFEGKNDAVVSISTSDINGKLLIWNV